MDRFEESERFMSSLSSNRSLLDHFSALRDPREGWRVLYPLPEILLLVSLEEPIRDPIAKLMDTSLKAHKRYFEFPAAAHDCFLKSSQR